MWVANWTGRAGLARRGPSIGRAAAIARAVSTEREQHIAVVGGGAAGFYAAGRILARAAGARVDIFERLPAPHGLVRYGVAPDHPEVKNCTAKFEAVAGDARARFFGNTAVGDESDGGGAVDLATLRRVYDGVVLAYGAGRDRALGIPGEERGVVAARRFVAWYNGLPEAQDLQPDLRSSDTAVVIGHGNVALDCARILLMDPDALARTDITARAVDALRASRVRHVVLAGRRGPLQVSFTTKEMREMTRIPGLRILCDRALLEAECHGAAGRAFLEGTRGLKRTMDLLLKHSAPAAAGASAAAAAAAAAAPRDGKTLTLSFLRSPVAVVATPAREAPPDGRTAPLAVRFRVNRLAGPPESARAEPTDALDEVACGMVLRSIGYASTPLAGAPFDARRCIVPNNAGRVLDADGQVVPGLYVAGWVKRGPVGVIATTMQDAYRTADAVVMDIEAGHIGGARSSRDAIDRALAAAGVARRCVSNDDWRRLDAFEVAAGLPAGKPREKVTDVAQMLDIMRARPQGDK